LENKVTPIYNEKEILMGRKVLTAGGSRNLGVSAPVTDIAVFDDKRNGLTRSYVIGKLIRLYNSNPHIIDGVD
jgi:hypothetical protein